MEGIWLGLSLACIVLGVYATINQGFAKSYMFFVLSLAAVLMFLLRRYKRKQVELNQSAK